MKKKSNKKTTSEKSIKYTGAVTVTVKKGDLTLSSVRYHNNGTLELFNFLCHCIAGNYQTANQKRPFKIQLRHNTGSAPQSANPDSSIQLSAFVSIDQSGLVLPIKEESEIKNYKAVLHFLVPYSFISSGGGDINQINLYGVSETDSSKYMAYYFLQNEDGTEWDPIAIDASIIDNSAYNLVIEWELSFNN